MFVTLLAVAGLRAPERKDERSGAATLRSCLALLKNGYVLAMVGAIFLYVGAEVCVSAGIPLFLKERFSIDIAKLGLLGTGLFFTALTIGRFSGGVILNWMAPRAFFKVTCAVSLAGLLGLFAPDRTVAIASFFLVGLGFANIFPLVFSIAVDSMPEHTNELSGLMVTAIVGGAFLPPLMGLVADRSSVQWSFLVPLAAIGSEQGWLFLDHGKVMPGMPKPVSEILEVKSGSWSGHDWKLAAYRALVRRGGVGAGIDGLCYLLQSADGDQGLCAPIPPWHAGASSESSTPESVTYIGGSFNNSAGAPDKTGWLFGMVRNNVAEVDIHFEDGRVIDAPTFAAPEALAAPVRFYGVELSDYRMYLTISKLVGLDAQGQIAACSADPAESSKTCS